MKPRLLLAALAAGLSLAPAVQAQVATPATLCGSMAELAVSVMQNRQYGVTREEMLALTSDDADETPVFRALIAEAYALPVQSTMALRQDAIEGFARAVEASCIQTVRGMT